MTRSTCDHFIRFGSDIQRLSRVPTPLPDTLILSADLHRGALCRQSSEAADVGEVDGNTVVGLGHHRLAPDELTGHGPALHQ